MVEIYNRFVLDLSSSDIIASIYGFYLQYSMINTEDSSKVTLLIQNYPDASTITVYDLLSRSVEKTLEFDHYASAIGVDPSGRIYLSGYEDESYKIFLLSQSGEILSQTESEEGIYSFCGFDGSNGNFYVNSYVNWVYWGYDHDMHVLRAGNVSGNTLSFSETLIIFVCQEYFHERQAQVSMLGDRYFCVDTTFHSGLSIWDSHRYDPLSPEYNNTEVVFLSRNNMETGEFDETASVGTRAVYRETTNSVIAFQDNLYIAEYDLETGEELFSARTDYPVFSMMEYQGGIAAIEKSGENFYFEYFPWKYASYVKINWLTAGRSKRN